MSTKAYRRWRVVLVFAFIYIAYRLALHWMVAAELGVIRRQDYPLTLTELDDWYSRPMRGVNAADIYLEAFKNFPPKEQHDSRLPVVGEINLPPRTQLLSDETRTAVTEYLARNARTVEALHKAAALEECRYPIDWHYGQPLARHSAQLRQAARLLVLEAIVYAETGRSREATQSIIAGLKLARSLDNEPFLISQLCEGACEATIIDTLGRCLTKCPFSDEQLTRLSDAIAGAHQHKGSQRFKRALIGERCLNNILLASNPCILASQLGWPLESLPRFFSVFVMLHRELGLRDIHQLSYLRKMRDYIAILALPFPERLSAAAAIDIERDGPAEKLDLLLTVTLPSIEGIAKRQAREEVGRNSALIAIALERFRLLGQILPESLVGVPSSSSMPSIPMDPFDGQPMRYRKLADGYVVYSVGEDGTDDGGDEKKDIAFTVER